MSYFIVDRRDRVAQRVTENAAVPGDERGRFAKIWAETIEEAFALALRSVENCLGLILPVIWIFGDGSYECPHCSYAVPVGSPEHAASKCPNPACFAHPNCPPEWARRESAEREARERAEAERVENARVLEESSRQRADEHARQIHQAGLDAASRNACVRCAMALARQYRTVRFVRHRGECPRARS